MDERAAAVALKRKREAEVDEERRGLDESPERDEVEQPKALQDAQQPKSKKRKVDGEAKATQNAQESPAESRKRKAQERTVKRERKREKKQKAKEKLQRQKAKKRESEGQSNTEDVKELHLSIPVDLDPVAASEAEEEEQQIQEADPPQAVSPSTASSEEDEEEVFSPNHESGTSSTSSIQPAYIDEPVKALEDQSPALVAPPPTLPSLQIDTFKTPQERLQEALSQFRAERKADVTENHTPKNRQELLEQRRRKEEAKKAAKKEQRRLEKEEEARRQDEEIARRFSPGGSGSLLASPRSPIVGDTNDAANDFTFGRIAFSDGTNFDSSTADAIEAHHKKGPRDAASQLQIAQTKKARVASLDESKRAEIEQKDMWLNAKKRAHGERVRDDTSLLKKALKRQQGQKKKSEKEWNDRIEGVAKAQDQRQKKRNDNLMKRKEEKRSGGKGKKVVKRPGFEGSFKGRTGGGKRKS